MPTIKFVNEKVTAEAADGEDIRSVAKKNGVQIYEGPHTVVNCMGFGLCGSCSVAIKNGNGNCTPPTLRERFLSKLLSPLPLLKIIGNPDKDVRLACQTRVSGDVDVETHPPIDWHGEKFWG